MEDMTISKQGLWFFAVEFYGHLGFVPTGTEQIVDGIRFTPMEMGNTITDKLK